MAQTAIKWHVENMLIKTLIKEHLEKVFKKAGFGELEISKTPMGTIITVKVVRPGLAIGRNGKLIHKVKRDLIKKFGIKDEIHLNIEKVDVFEQSAQIMAEHIVMKIESGYYGPKAIKNASYQIKNSGSVSGCKIILSGKWRSGNRARTIKTSDGPVFHSGDPAKNLVD